MNNTTTFWPHSVSLASKYAINTYEKPQITSQLYEALANYADPYVQAFIGSYRNVPVTNIEQLIGYNNDIIDYNLIQNPSYRVMFLKGMLNPTKNYQEIELNFTKNFKIPKSTFEKIYNMNVPEYFHILGEHPQTPEEIIDQIITEFGDNLLIMEGITKNINLTHAHFKKISKNSNLKILMNIAYNEYLPLDLFYKLASHSHEIIRGALAYNKNCPVELRKSLMEDDSAYVRRMVGYNKNISNDELAILIKDEKTTVREAAAWSMNCPDSLLQGCAFDPAEEVRAIVAFKSRNEKTLQQLSYSLSKSIQSQLFLNTFSSEEVVERVVFNCKDINLLSLSLSHRNITKKALEYLIMLNDSNINNSIAFSHHKFPDILASLYVMTNKDKKVQNMLGKNENTPLEILNDIYKSNNSIADSYLAKNKRLPKNMALEIIHKYKSNLTILASVARNSKDEIVLNELLNLNVEEIYQEIVKNENTSSRLLMRIPDQYSHQVQQHKNYKSVAENILDIFNLED